MCVCFVCVHVCVNANGPCMLHVCVHVCNKLFISVCVTDAGWDYLIVTHDFCTSLQPPNLELHEAMLENIGQGVEPSRTSGTAIGSIGEQQQKQMNLESSSCSGCSRGAVAQADRIGE